MERFGIPVLNLDYINVLLGFLSNVARFPWDNIGVAVFSNDNDFGGLLSQVITYRLFDEALGLEPIDWDGRCVRFRHTARFFDSNTCR